jgi:hypothetical protein
VRSAATYYEQQRVDSSVARQDAFAFAVVPEGHFLPDVHCLLDQLHG